MWRGGSREGENLVRREGIEPSTYRLRVGSGGPDEAGRIGVKRDGAAASPYFPSTSSHACPRFVTTRAATVGPQPQVLLIVTQRDS